MLRSSVPSSFFFGIACLLISVATCVDRAAGEDRPNILWITAEDMSATLGCYGDKFANTPNIDRLASESIRYTHAFATSPVCSPSRSCLINGCIATTQGTHPMRSLFPIPSEMAGFPAVLRQAGYFTSNNVKTDYNTSSEAVIIDRSWDANGSQASWGGRNEGQPFFSVHNLMTSHQSRTMVWPYEQFEEEVASRLESDERHSPAAVPVPPYYPDTPLVRRTMARYYDCVTAMDKEVGQILAQLDADGLTDSTIVFFYSDHGSGMPRHKRALFDSGTHVPLLIRFPERFKHLTRTAPGNSIDRLVCFEDFGPAVLSLAGISEPPEYMRGKAFLGFQDKGPRDYVFCHRDRVDEVTDMARSIRSKQYLYIRNFMPHRGYHQPSAWVDAGKVKDDFYALADSGRMTPAQKQFLGGNRPAEELYDCQADPMNLNNLAGHPQLAETLAEMREALHREMIDARDLGLVPEIEMRLQTKGTTPHEAAARGAFNFEKLLRAAELVGTDDWASVQMNLEDPDPSVRFWAAVACHAARSIPDSVAAALKSRLQDPSPIVRIESAAVLAQSLGDAEATEVLVKLLEDTDETTVLYAARELEMLADPAVRPQIQSTADKYAEAPGDLAWCIRFTTSAYLKRVR